MKHLLLTTIAAVVLVGCSDTDVSMNGGSAFYKNHIFAETFWDKPGPFGLSFGFVFFMWLLLRALRQREQNRTSDQDTTYSSSSTALHTAAKSGRKEVAEMLIAKGADLEAKSGRNASTPLHLAAGGGHKEVVELLIAKGADVNAICAVTLWTPLQTAINYHHKGVVELLIAAGTDVNIMDVHGLTPVDLAVEYMPDTREIANLLRKHGGKTAEELKAKGK